MPSLSRIKWLCGQVTPLEVAARLRLKCLERASRRWRPRVPAGITTRSVFAALAGREPLKAALDRGGIAAETVAEADRVMAGEFTLFGGFAVSAPGGVPDWLAAFPGGERWDGAAHSVDVDVAGNDGRDVRFTWELSRHGDLVALSRAAFVTGDARYGERLAALLTSWMDANPYLLGPNWTSALEVAMRAISWAFIDDATAGMAVPLSEPPLRSRFVETLFLHGAHLDRFVSVGLNPSNHIIGEAAGLFVLGTKFRDTAMGKAWRGRGRRLLETEIARQTFPSGASREQSTGYHRFVTGLFGLCLAVGGERAFSARYKERLRAMYAFLDTIARPDGTFARLGDGDDAVSLRLSPPRPDDLSDDLALGAALFPDMDLRLRPVTRNGGSDALKQPALFADALIPARRPSPQALWLMGPTPVTPVTPAARRSVIVDGAGLAVLKSASGALQVELDAGPQGYSPVSSHGHADALSVTLWRDGNRLADPGTFRYNGAPAWRDAFRSTPFHSTVTVDGRSQAAPDSAFRWLDLADAKVTGSFLSDDLDWVAGTLAPSSARDWSHTREVLRVGSGFLFVVDTVGCRGPHFAESYFHLGEAKVTLDGPAARVRYPDKREMRILSLDGVPFEAAGSEAQPSGDSDAARPWYSPSYGLKSPSAALVARHAFTNGTVLRWLLILDPGYVTRALSPTVGSAVALEVKPAETKSARSRADADRRIVFVSMPEWNIVHVDDMKFIGRWGVFEFAGAEMTRAWGAQGWILEHAGRRLYMDISNEATRLMYSSEGAVNAGH